VKFWPSKHERAEKPDVEKAREDLARIRAQRAEVDDLVAALVREKRLNNFTANVVVTFKGGRA
jgi:hypothetical protein